MVFVKGHTLWKLRGNKSKSNSDNMILPNSENALDNRYSKKTKRLKEDTIDRSWQIVNRAIGKKSKLPLDKQIIIAKEIVVKDISTRLIQSGNKDTKIIIIKPASATELNPVRIITPTQPIVDITPDKQTEGNCA